MMRTRLGAVPGVVLLALCVSLAACGGDDSEEQQASEQEQPAEVEIASIEAGDCLDVGSSKAAQDDAAFASDRVVDCDDDHQFEVVAVVDVPDDLVTDELTDPEYREELDASWDDLDADKTIVAISDWAISTCQREFAVAAGLDVLEIEGDAGAEDFAVLPATSGVTSWSVYPEESWEERPRVACLARYSQLADDFDAASSRLVDVDGGFLLGDFLSADFPAEFRQCGTYDAADNFSAIDCDEPHYQEFGITFDATDMIDSGFHQRIADAVAANEPLSDRDYQVLDALCTQALEVMVGEDVDTDVLKALGELGGGWDQARESRNNWVSCSVTAVESTTFDLPGGSVIGIGDATVEPVPFG